MNVYNTGLFNVDNISPYKEQKPAEPVGSIKRMQEVVSVISNLSGSKQLAAELMYGTGMRLNEVLALRILDVDFDMNE